MYINVTYDIVCTMARGGFQKNLVAEIEYMVEIPVRGGRCRHVWCSLAAVWPSTHTPLSRVSVRRRCVACARAQTTAPVRADPVSFEIKPEALENVKKVRGG